MDIDIDVKNRDELLKHIRYVPATECIAEDRIKKHIVGIHVQNIPTDPLSGFAAFDYKKAESLGFFKLDILNNNVYKHVDNKTIELLLSFEPDWNMLKKRHIVEKLPHIHNHYDLINRFEPKNVDEMAAFLALIRPAKKYLRKKSKLEIMQKIWKKERVGYTFKKSHAYAYALMIMLFMNYLKLVEKGVIKNVSI